VASFVAAYTRRYVFGPAFFGLDRPLRVGQQRPAERDEIRRAALYMTGNYQSSLLIICIVALVGILPSAMLAKAGAGA